MRYFDYIGNENLERLFLKKPQYFNRDTDKELLKYSLGAFIYVPATRYDMAYKTVSGKVMGARPLAICLEDAVGAAGEEEAIKNLELILKNFKDDNVKNIDDIPLIFIRIKDANQLEKIKKIITDYEKIITGILIPKCD